MINHYVGSVRHGTEFRPFDLAREWVGQGHRVRTVAASHPYIRAQASDLKGQARLDERIDGVDHTWFAAPAYRGNGAGRIPNMRGFVLRLVREARALTRNERPHVVIASSTYPLDIWPAHRIARLLFEVHDLWPLSPMELGGYTWRWPSSPVLRTRR